MSHTFLSGGGDMAALIEAKDWAATPLGPIDQWPQSLRTAVSLCLAADAPISITWGDENTQLYNDRYRALCGERHPQALGEAYHVTWASAWEATRDLFARAKAGQAVHLEPQHIGVERAAHGGGASFTVSTSPIRDESGGVGGLFHLVTDTTATALAGAVQHEWLATLRDSETRLRLAVEAGQIGEWELDVLTNTSVRALRHDQIFGHPEPVAEWGFPTFLSHVLPEDRDAVESAYRQAADHGTGWNFECRIQRADDHAVRWIRAHSTSQVNAMGQVVKMFGLVQDITDQKLLEIGMAELNSTLEQRICEAVEERAKAEDQLRQAQKLEALGQLTGGVAHDFNNLLTVVRSSVDLLKRPNLPEERRSRYMSAISDAVNRATRITSQLLAFSRRQSLKPETFDVSQSVRNLVEMIETLTGSGIETTLALSVPACFAHADTAQFDAALINLAVNARDAMNGKGQLRLSVQVVADIPEVGGQPAVAGPFVAISMKDTGSGIAPDHVDRIFEPFFTTKSVGHGTGLGLSQVFGFAKQSGGDVRVFTTPGAGAEFVLYLPRTLACLTSDQGPVNDHPASPSRPLRVLVVEDNADVGTFATQALLELGYKTTWAGHAEQALTELREHPEAFDVVFSDVMMPGMDGIALGREIRRLYPGLPVVLTSGYSQVIAQEGTHGFELLDKPYSVEQLLQVLHAAVQCPSVT